MADFNPYAIDETEVDTSNFIPSHPGAMIRRTIKSAGVTLTDAAAAIKTPNTFLSAMLSGSRPISIDMAVRMEAAFGLDAQMVHGMSDLYESHKAIQKREEIVAGIQSDVFARVEKIMRNRENVGETIQPQRQRQRQRV